MMDKTYTREEYVYLAKLYERAERYEDMVMWITKFIQLEPKLSMDERNILSAGFKNIIGSKRSSWRLLQNLERKEEKKGGNNNTNLNSVREVKVKVENEMRRICDDIQNILDKYLVPTSTAQWRKQLMVLLPPHLLISRSATPVAAAPR